MVNLVAGLLAAALAWGASPPDPEVRSRLQAIGRAYEDHMPVKAKLAAAELAARGGRTLEDACEIGLENSPGGGFEQPLDERWAARALLPMLAAGRQERVRPRLLETARGDIEWNAVIAIEILVGIGDRGAGAALAELVERPVDGAAGKRGVHSAVRIRAAQALASLGDPAAVGLARRHLLKDPDFTARLVAVRDVLGRIGGPEAREGLTEALKDENAVVRRVAETALARLDGAATAAAVAPPPRRTGGPVEGRTAWSNLTEIRSRAKAVRGLLAGLPEGSFQSNPLTVFSLEAPAGIWKASPSEVRRSTLEFLDNKVLAPLEMAEGEPAAALWALRSLLSGVYDHADGTLGGYPGDDIVPKAADQKELQASLLRMVGLYPSSYAATGSLGPAGGKVILAGGSEIAVPPGALSGQATIILVGPHENDGNEAWGQYPSGLGFAKPAVMTMAHRNRDPNMVYFLSGVSNSKVSEESGDRTRIEVDGFW